MTDSRNIFVEEAERLTEGRGSILERIRTEADHRKRNALVFILRMVNADILKYKK